MFNLQQITVAVRPLFLSLGFLFCAATIGCTETVRWVRPDTDPRLAEQQLAACTLQMELNYYSDSESKEQREARIGRWTKLCMQANGFSKSKGESESSTP